MPLVTWWLWAATGYNGRHVQPAARETRFVAMVSLIVVTRICHHLWRVEHAKSCGPRLTPCAPPVPTAPPQSPLTP